MTVRTALLIVSRAAITQVTPVVSGVISPFTSVTPVVSGVISPFEVLAKCHEPPSAVDLVSACLG